MTYDSVGHAVADIVDPEGLLNEEGCLQRAIFFINEGMKKNTKQDSEDTRSAGEVMQAVQTVQGLLSSEVLQTDAAIVLAAIQILAAFSLKMVDKLKDK